MQDECPKLKKKAPPKILNKDQLLNAVIKRTKNHTWTAEILGKPITKKRWYFHCLQTNYGETTYGPEIGEKYALKNRTSSCPPKSTSGLVWPDETLNFVGRSKSRFGNCNELG